MSWLLVPGRHHLLTEFQLGYLRDVLERESAEAVVWAVTSANHHNTRRNPLPAHRREAAIELFGTGLPAPSLVYHIDDIGTSDRFAEYVIKKIEVDSRGLVRLTPENARVACSTPEVAALYEALGFTVLPMELERRPGCPAPETPWALLQGMAAAGARWRKDPGFLRKVSKASRRIYLKYRYGDLLAELHASRALTEDGDLTGTRDYNVYVRSLDEGAERKYELVKGLVLPGRIVDVGCCTGAVLRLMSCDDRLRECDLYGVELARPLYAECLRRKERGDFGNENVFFYNADATRRELFAPASIATITTFSLTHELESYRGRASLEDFIALVRGQLAPGGRWLNVDVVGPEDGVEPAWLWLSREDGRDSDWEASFEPEDRERYTDYLRGLSTRARFLRFARDFRRGRGVEFETDPARPGLVRLSLRDACEFLGKKDYIENWDSELQETFCFWSFSDWRRAVERAGLAVHPASRAFVNPWIVKNRYEGKVRLLEERGGGLEPIPYPPTTMLLAAERR